MKLLRVSAITEVRGKSVRIHPTARSLASLRRISPEIEGGSQCHEPLSLVIRLQFEIISLVNRFPRPVFSKKPSSSKNCSESSQVNSPRCPCILPSSSTLGWITLSPSPSSCSL